MFTVDPHGELWQHKTNRILLVLLLSYSKTVHSVNCGQQLTYPGLLGPNWMEDSKFVLYSNVWSTEKSQILTFVFLTKIWQQPCGFSQLNQTVSPAYNSACWMGTIWVNTGITHFLKRKIYHIHNPLSSRVKYLVVTTGCWGHFRFS